MRFYLLFLMHNKVKYERKLIYIYTNILILSLELQLSVSDSSLAIKEDILLIFYFEIPITPQANLAPAFPVFNDSKFFPLPKSSLFL